MTVSYEFLVLIWDWFGDKHIRWTMTMPLKSEFSSDFGVNLKQQNSRVFFSLNGPYEHEMNGDGSIRVTLDPWFDGRRHSRMSLEWNWCLRRYIWVNMWNDEMKFCWWVNWVHRDSLDSVDQALANQSTVRLFAQVLVVLCQKPKGVVYVSDFRL